MIARCGYQYTCPLPQAMRYPPKAYKKDLETAEVGILQQQLSLGGCMFQLTLGGACFN